MCGIAGQIGRDPRAIQGRYAAYCAMQRTLARRGPDQRGMYISGRAALIHARLAVVDLENGCQPMQLDWQGESYTVVYNGELYNTPELRALLERRGHTFTGRSDTEVLLHAYAEWGISCVERFNGIFAFAVWAARAGTLFRQGVEESAARNPGWQAALFGNTVQLLVVLQRARTQAHTLPPPEAKVDLLDALLAYIEGHLSEKITLADTARQFLVSESTIDQLFRKRMKASFYHFVTQRRLIAAKTELLEGATAEQAAARTGFGDYSTFYRAFRREYGISPAEYRRRNTEK